MTEQWTHANPVRLLAGCGTFQQLGKQLKPGNWLLITSAGATRRGLTAKVQSQQPDTTRLQIWDQITPNPELDELDRLTRHFRQEKITGLIALGGGSVMDAAKILSVTLPSSLDKPLATTLRTGQKQAWQKHLPVIALPTTSGTGAEVTPFATVWDQTEHKKYSVTGDQLYPEQALLDPELTLTLPHEETIYTALDAISHALESLWNKNKTPISEAWSWRALELANDALPRILVKPDDLQAREKMQQASLLAGLAISQTRTAIAHSISYPLTSHYGVPHGLACSFTLPTLIKSNFKQLATGDRSPLVSRLLNLLQGLRMDTIIGNYLTTADALALIREMTAPGRADNYVGLVDINDILQQAM